MTTVDAMLAEYHPKNADQYRQAFKEVMQEIVLCGLSRGGFFERAAFTGGTALRIIHGIKRFSEDLDFSLLQPDDSFSFAKYLPYVKNELNASGFDIEFGNIRETAAVKSAFIKADTYKLLMNFSSLDPAAFRIGNGEKIKVKMEIDTNPPAGAQYEETAKTLPSPHIIRTLDPPSMFALKCHAIMCRKYVKGRDYYDYQWFLHHGTMINATLLQNALIQTEGETLRIPEIIDRLKDTFAAVDIQEVQKDTRRFLEDPNTISSWSNSLFVETVPELQFVDARANPDRRNTDHTLQTLVVMAGIPGAGKQAEAEKYRSILPDAIYIRTNDIRKELNAGTAPEDNDQVIAAAYKRVVEALRYGRNVIYVATNLDKDTRSDILHLADGLQNKKIRKILNVVYKNPSSAEQNQNYHVPKPVLRNMAMILNNNQPDLSEGWNQIVITGKQPTRDDIYAGLERQGKEDFKNFAI